MKKCSRCGEIKEKKYFSKDIQKKDLLRPSCKLCNKKGLSHKERQQLYINNYISKGYKICSKCKQRLSLDKFHKDITKYDGYYSSCDCCRRISKGSKELVPAKEENCNFCGKIFKPRVNQFGNKSGKIFCSMLCYHKFYEEDIKTYYNGYKKYILERDKKRCVISGRTDNLVIHHIKTRGSGGTDEYCNLVTLNAHVHIGLVHGLEGYKYRHILEEYVSQFERPFFWDKIMEISKRNTEKVKNNYCEMQKKRYKRNKNKTNAKAREHRKELNEKCKNKYGKKYGSYIKYFKEKYGTTPSKYKYNKMKEYKKSVYP